jgi:hypothetical protein
MVSSQICAAVMLLVQLGQANDLQVVPLTTRQAARIAVALAFGSIALVWVILVVKPAVLL